MDINVIVTGVLLVLSFTACVVAARCIEKAREHRAEAASMLAEARDKRADALRINAETASLLAYAPISADEARRIYADLTGPRRSEAGVK